MTGFLRLLATLLAAHHGHLRHQCETRKCISPTAGHPSSDAPAIHAADGIWGINRTGRPATAQQRSVRVGISAFVTPPGLGFSACIARIAPFAPEHITPGTSQFSACVARTAFAFSIALSCGTPETAVAAAFAEAGVGIDQALLLHPATAISTRLRLRVLAALPAAKGTVVFAVDRIPAPALVVVPAPFVGRCLAADARPAAG